MLRRTRSLLLNSICWNESHKTKQHMEINMNLVTSFLATKSFTTIQIIEAYNLTTIHAQQILLMSI